MTTQPNDHFRHAHLDGGQCLDGSGRSWQPDKFPGPVYVNRDGSSDYRVLSPAEVELRRLVDTLMLRLLMLSVVVLLNSAVIVALAIEGS